MESNGSMKRYLVGGAVRDRLLGRTVTDKDWVVVGSTPDDLLAKGFRPVGRDFPVFLHPETNEEHALARTERKTGPGYHGFDFDTSTSVTLEEDLSRRDLTINAIAEDVNGELVDPYDGQGDLQRRLLRHVSPAFVEDPLRVLRVARFMARLAPLGFTIAPETRELMREIGRRGELSNLVAERVWQELDRALGEAQPRAFIESLRDSDTLAEILPEVDALFGVPQPERWHPEIDSGIHTLMVLDQASALSESTIIRYAALCHDLGKGTTPPEIWPAHHGHEERGADLCVRLADRFRVPKQIRDFSILVARYHTHCHRAFELRPGSVVKLFKSLDVVRRPERFEDYLTACLADIRGRLGFESEPYPQADFLREAAEHFCAVDAASIAGSVPSSADIPDAIQHARVQAISALSRERTGDHLHGG